MNEINWQEVETIVDRALIMPEERRNEFVEEACGDDKRLKGEVTLLLESIFESEGWLEEPGEYKKDFYHEVSDNVELLSADRSLIGKRVGSYTVREKIGEGGMGMVYLANRTDGTFEHKVAIKVLRHTFASENNIRRFRREQRILAGFNHPGIARLYDGGITGDGSPYIIMEYVNGSPIDRYCKENRCTIEGKIDLFKQVLQAVRHAHENLVVHRDLKPGNILVKKDGNVKILDFGISKLLQEEIDDITLTKTGTRMLTPKYAAPEQIRQQTCTTTTDLYTLGVLFYELLAGINPHHVKRINRYNLEQFILEQDPAPPSSKVEKPTLKKQLKGDLDAICLKAIRKEPEHRYRVANEWLKDLSSYEKGQPVSAREDTTRYRVRKFIKRHKQGIATTAGVLVLILGFVSFYTVNITEQKNQAQQEAQRAEAAAEFLTTLFKSNDPVVSGVGNPSASELLERGYERIEEMTNPTTKAHMLLVLGEVYSDIGYAEKARNLLEEAIRENEKIYGRESFETYRAILARGEVEANQHNYDLALPYHREAYQTITSLAEPDDSQVINAMQQYGKTLRYVGKVDSSEAIIRNALSLQQKYHPDDSANQNETKGILALILRKQQKLEEAKQLYLNIISSSKPKDARDSLALAGYHNNLAFVHIDTRAYDQALEHLHQSLLINEEIRGPGHPTSLTVRSNIVGVLREQNRTDSAINFLQKATGYVKSKFGETHWQTAKKYSYLGYLLTVNGDLKQGEIYLRRSAEIYEQTLGSEHKWTAVGWSKLVANLYIQDKTRAADSLFTKNMKILKAKSSDFRPVNIDQIEDVISLYQKSGYGNLQQVEQYRQLIHNSP